jgi:steroid 5-alpha reductase family enzyme
MGAWCTMLALGTSFTAPGEVTAVAAIAVAVLFLGLWAVSLILHDVSIVDPVWGPAFALVALVALVVGDAVVDDGGDGRRWLLFGMTALWGVRLGGYLLVRKHGDPGEDRRYAKMRERRGDGGFAVYSLFVVFLFQGLLVLIVALPVQIAAQRATDLGWVAAIGVAVWLVGLFFEAVGDEQLRRFKARPDSTGQVMDRGLWRYTRHPNYFGDFCVWWGLWLVALDAGGTWWTAVGPLVMSFLLIKGSGAALLERDIGERRPQYADYIRRTSSFFPRPPRRVRAGS